MKKSIGLAGYCYGLIAPRLLSMAFIRFYNYNGHGYGLYVKPETHDAAHAMAKDSGGYLVEINDSNENDFIKEILSKDLKNLDRDLTFDYADKTLTFDRALSTAPDGGGAGYIWTGGSDAQSEGTWIWRNSRKPISMSSPEWGAGNGVQEPDGGLVQNALGFGLTSWPQPLNAATKIGDYGQWNDIDQTNSLYSLVEYDYPVDEKFGFKVETGGNPEGDINAKQPNAYARARLRDTYNDSILLRPGQSYDYKIYDLGEGRYGLQAKGSDQIDEITGVGKVKYDDSEMSLKDYIAPTYKLVEGKDDVTGKCYRLYSAAFTRLPDPSGLKFWIESNRDGSNTLASTSDAFTNSPEFKDRYGASTSDRDYISTLYNNVLGRVPDESGFNFWENAMSSGLTRGDILTEFSESSENKNLFSQLSGIL